ncbi:MAG: S1 RNA-binding domain-containing protein [Spirochaetes bacterium]|nr:S1 RNA-binding domain-containing protein [Spirochaetota bacterium]
MDHTPQDHIESIDMEHVADSAMEEIQPGKIIRGEIVTIDSEFAYVNVGTKLDGRIPLHEFSEPPAIGDSVEVLLNNKSFVDGMYQFSKNAAETEKRWQEFLTRFDGGPGTIEGRIVSATNKGKIVDCGGVHVFLPFSLAADLKGVSSTQEEYTFKVKSFEKKKRSIVVSRKDYLDEENVRRWNEFCANYKIGDRITGKVIKFVEFGAFVRIAGIDALLHRNDMTWKKIFKQRKILKLNEEREFIILDYNREEGKISLGLRQLQEDPWAGIGERYKTGDAVQGTVSTVTNYGAFVEIEDGIEGFVGNSELSWTKSGVRASDLFKKGDQGSFMILDINSEERKLSLGYKQLQANPWDTIEADFPVGSVHRTRIKKIVKFGMFVELNQHIDGLVHLSDISWDDNTKDATSRHRVNDEVEIKILEIRKEDRKISCGMKQLLKSPWEVISERYPVRTKVEGTVSGITPFGLFVKLEDNVEGLVHISEVSRRKIEDLSEYYTIGDPVSVMVLGVDVDKKRLSLSIKSFEIQSEKEELEKIIKNTSPSTVTLGDIVNIKLGE